MRYVLFRYRRLSARWRFIFLTVLLAVNQEGKFYKWTAHNVTTPQIKPKTPSVKYAYKKE